MSNMKKDNFKRKLLRLVIPITLQQIMLALVSFTDAVMMGFIDQDSLSAVSLAGQVQFVFSLFIFSVTGGVSILAAQYWGIKDRRSVEKILGIGLKILVLLSVPFTLGTLIFPETIMKCFASEPILIEKGAQYLRAVSFSYLFLGFSQPYLCIMKNCGRAGKSSLISSVSVIVNIIFNYFLIFGIGFFPRLEIRGAAIATVISKAVELIWAYSVCLKNDSIKIRMKYILHNDKVLKRIIGNMLFRCLEITLCGESDLPCIL